MSGERDTSQDPMLPIGFRENVSRVLRQQALLRRIKRALPDLRREYLSYGSDQYLPQLDHFLALKRAGARESDVVPLELSIAVQRAIAYTSAFHRH